MLGLRGDQAWAAPRARTDGLAVGRSRGPAAERTRLQWSPCRDSCWTWFRKGVVFEIGPAFLKKRVTRLNGPVRPSRLLLQVTGLGGVSATSTQSGVVSSFFSFSNKSVGILATFTAPSGALAARAWLPRRTVLSDEVSRASAAVPGVGAVRPSALGCAVRLAAALRSSEIAC